MRSYFHRLNLPVQTPLLADETPGENENMNGYWLVVINDWQKIFQKSGGTHRELMTAE